MKTVLILGAKSDIAKALAQEFARNNFNLQLAARNVSSLHSFSETLKNGDNDVSLEEFDALDYRNHRSFYNKLQVEPDLVIVCFGYLGNQLESQSSFKEAEKIIGTNFLGAISMLEVVAEQMEQNKKGKIIGISSVAGERGKKSNYMYGSSKAGFTAYLEGLRQRLSGSGVHVLTVKPGFVSTKMTQDMKLNPWLTTTPQNVAHQVFKAYKGGKNVIYSKSIWRLLMWIIRNIPERIYKNMNL